MLAHINRQSEVELLDPSWDDDEDLLLWRGTLGAFIDANAEDGISYGQMQTLCEIGEVAFGGGAAPIVLLRSVGR